MELKQLERPYCWKIRFVCQGVSHIWDMNSNALQSYRPIISEYLKLTEPNAVEAWWYKRFKRRTFIAIGPNEMWSLDQHDKFKCYCHEMTACAARLERMVLVTLKTFGFSELQGVPVSPHSVA